MTWQADLDNPLSAGGIRPPTGPLQTRHFPFKPWKHGTYLLLDNLCAKMAKWRWHASCQAQPLLRKSDSNAGRSGAKPSVLIRDRLGPAAWLGSVYFDCQRTG